MPVTIIMNRRQFIRAAGVALGACSAFRMSAATPGPKESPGSHALDSAWPDLSKELYPEPCQISGVAIAKDGNILALNRGENPWMPKVGFKKETIRKPAVLVIDPRSGKLLGSWGTGVFVMPHQISVDATGHIWIVDCGSNTVFKFDAKGAKLMELGGAEIGFKMPTDVAGLSDGSFVVSDGYTNTRVVKFDRSGRQIAAWGTKGKGPLQFQTPHSVACAPDDVLYIADRENHRIQVLDAHGKLQAIWTNVERPLTIRHRGGFLYVLSNLDAAQGIVRKMTRKGEIVEAFHTLPPGSSGDFEWPHGLAVNGDGREIYVGFTLTGRRIQRYRQVPNA